MQQVFLLRAMRTALRLMVSAWIATFVLAQGTNIALAAELPFYAVEQWCDQVARRSLFTVAACAKNSPHTINLKRSWSGFPSQTQSWCDRVARSGGAGSYMLLEGCVQQELNAANDNATRPFRR